MDQQEKEKAAALRNTPQRETSFEFDPDGYLPMVQEFDGSDEQKIELLRALWNVMTSFVDLGFGVDSIQSIFPEFFENAASERSGMLEYQLSEQITSNEDAADDPSGGHDTEREGA